VTTRQSCQCSGCTTLRGGKSAVLPEPSSSETSGWKQPELFKPQKKSTRQKTSNDGCESKSAPETDHRAVELDEFASWMSARICRFSSDTRANPTQIALQLARADNGLAGYSRVGKQGERGQRCHDNAAARARTVKAAQLSLDALFVPGSSGRTYFLDADNLRTARGQEQQRKSHGSSMTPARATAKKNDATVIFCLTIYPSSAILLS
jgi:hypothetical protein